MAVEQPRTVPFAPAFRVGDWLVEPSLDRLSRNGSTIHLRPQLTNLLVVLARNAGRTVSKSQILASVWDGQFVAESGMTRCIAELRHVLGDDAREPTILETIHKRGYRVIAPVVSLEEAGPKPGSTGDREARPDPCSTGDPGEDVASPSPAIDAAAAAQGHLPRWAVGTGLTATLLVALAWGALGWTPEDPVHRPPDSVLLADVRNTTGDPAFDHTLRLALAVQLGDAPFLQIISTDDVRKALSVMGRPQDEPVVGDLALDVCRRQGGAVLLASSIARLGTHYAVGIEAIACGTGESIGRELLEAQSEDAVLSALGTGAGRIRQKLSASRAALHHGEQPVG